MRPAGFLQIVAVVALLPGTQAVFGQVSQLNAGGGPAATTTFGGGGGGGQNLEGGSTAGGGTTESLGGVTTEALGAAADEQGGFAGANLVQEFIGQNNLEAFVGGGVTTQNNGNRQFRALTEADIATGSSSRATGNPRRIPTSLRVAFSYPAAEASTLLIGPRGPAIKQIVVARPEFRSVVVKVDPKGVATLTGQVPSPDVSRLAANLVRLRPGVRKVQNQIQVVAKQAGL